MREDLKKDILDVLKDSYKAINKNDILLLKETSDHVIHKASIMQDEDSTTVAVLIYSLSKIFERPHYRDYKDWPLFYKTCMKNLEVGITSLGKDNIEGFQDNINNILNVIDKLESHLKNYIQEVIEKAKIHRASRIHEHGISVERTAKLLGISSWELMDYIGKTGISDIELSQTKTAKERLKLVREIFK